MAPKNAFHRVRPPRALTRGANLTPIEIDNPSCSHTVSPSLRRVFAPGEDQTSFRLGRAVPPRLATYRNARHAMCSTDVCHPNHSLRVPAPRVFLVAGEIFTSCARQELWGSSRLPRGPGVSRRLDRFGGSSSNRNSTGAFCAYPRRGRFLPTTADATEPLIPPSPLPSDPVERTFVRFSGACESRQDRFHRAPVMRRGLVGPRYLPSIRTLHVVQSPLQRWARDRCTFLSRDVPTAAWCLSHHARPRPVSQR